MINSKQTPNKNSSDNIRIEYQEVGKSFNNRDQDGLEENIVAVKNINLKVNDGEVVSLIGPSGCGKSTLLNMGSGLYQPTVGEVFIDQEKVDKPNSHVGFMLQKDLLLPWRNIRENVEFGLEINGTNSSQRKKRSSELLEKCRLSGFENHYPHQLSGGMRQRAALARTMATEPRVLLMDEPFSALDAQTKMILQQDLAETLFSENKTALFITHDLTESVALSDRVFVMSQRPGTIIEQIDIDLPLRENPMARRHDLQKEVGEYVAQLMTLLNVDELAIQEEV